MTCGHNPNRLEHVSLKHQTYYAVNQMPQYPPLAQVDLPLLVTGIAGVAGYNAFHYYSKLYPGQVIGIRRNEYWPLSGNGIVGCDIVDRTKLIALFDELTKHQTARNYIRYLHTDVVKSKFNMESISEKAVEDRKTGEERRASIR